MANKWLRFLWPCLGANIAFAVIQAPVPPRSTVPLDTKHEAIAWKTSYADGLAEAKRTGKKVLLDFYAPWCGPCRLMESEVYSDPHIVEFSKEFVCIKINVDEDEATAFKYKVSAIPRALLLDSAGAVLADATGFLDPQQFGKFLREPAAPAAAPAPPPPKLDALDAAGLVPFLTAQEPAVRKEAETRLTTLGAKALPALVGALAHPQLGIRIAAYSTLRKLRGKSPEFDPWAAKAERDRAVEQWKKWLAEQDAK